MARVTAGWARHGKEAGSHRDYAILESDGPFSAGDYDAILERYALGNPPPGRTGAEALPWITISEVQDDRNSYLGMSVQYWTDAADGAGRPVAETLYACFPYPQFLKAPASYRVLGAILDRHDDLGGPGAEISDYAPEDHVRDIEENGWLGRAMVVAAMLLEGPVTIIGGDGLDPDRRLRFLDAVAALLPYGWRTRFTASTWFRGGSPHIQLVFAQHSRGKGYDLDWRDTDPEPPFKAQVARAYMDQFALLLDHDRSLLDVVAFLGTQTLSLAADEPRSAVAALERFDWPAAVLYRARAGEADPGELSDLFESGRHNELLRDADKAFLLHELIRLGGPQYSRAIERGWEDVEPARPDAWKALVNSARDLVWGDSAMREVHSYIGIGDRQGFADQLLANVIPMPGFAVSARSLNTVAWLAGSWADPAGAARPQTLKALADNHAVLCELLVEQNESAPGRLPAWIAALRPLTPPGLLAPFEKLLAMPGTTGGRGRNGGRLRPEDLAEVARHGDECVPALLRLASALGRLDQVTRPLIDWLRALPGAGLNRWLARLEGLTPEHGSDLALLDVLQLWFGAEPTHLVAAIGPQWPAYRDALTRHARAEWLGRGLGNVQAGFVTYLTQTNWAADQNVYPAVIEAVEAFCQVPGHDWTELVRAALRGRAISPGMDACAEYRRWWRGVEGAYPFVVEEQYMEILTALPPGARPEEIGRLVAEALWMRHSEREILAWIARSEVRMTGDSMAHVMNETRRWYVRLGASQEDADNTTLWLAQALHRGDQRALAHDFQDAVAARVGDELLFQLKLLTVTSRVPPDYDEVDVAEGSRRGLREAEERIRNLLGKRKLLGGR
ncbi:hypothetical protein J4573_45480 [Actinomadura barringtoniae]|uniref:Uncharacterized protein n=1 Tax=Actinomadura barringtoniae TaxID=1427535 RepID=A0A939PK56_9ACTN|nr:hypothetical protein [Actinomadura barringtoniae]MBO2454407.1 hypothetical protein [Actinomadura barringtoniae]